MVNPSTTLLIKRSGLTAKPSSLKAGELAYSYLSDTLFIGDSTGSAVANIGGVFYTSQIDNATAANTASTIVRRDANNAFYGRLYGNANTTTALETARDFSISGGDMTASSVSFDGTGDVVLNASLNAVPGLTAGTYGGVTTGSTTVPVVTVAANGRVIAISTVDASSSFTISDGSNTDVVNSGETLTFAGSTGITTLVSNNEVTFGTDRTVLRSNTTMADVGTQTIGTDLNITGNVTITGTTTTVDSTVIVAENSLIELAANNTTGDVIDIGFYGNHSGGSITGLVRDASTKDYYLFDNVSLSDLDGAANVITTGAMAAGLTTLHANVAAPLATITQATITSANVSSGLGVMGGTTTDALAVTGAATVGTTLGVTGATTLSSTLSVSGATSLTSTLGVTGAATLSGGATVSSGLSTDTLSASGNASVGGTLGVTGAATMSGGATVTSGLSSDTLSVSGASTLGTVSAGATTISGGLTSDSASVTGNASVGGTLGVTGAATFSSTVSTGALTSSSASVTGNASVGGTFSVTGASTLGTVSAGATTISGGLSTDTMSASGNASVGGTLGVTGDTTLGGALSVTGAVSLTQQLTVPNGGTGVTSFTSQGIVYGNGTGAMQVTAAAGVADQHSSNQLLTVDGSGNPIWTDTLDCGSF
jgi:hypothetical protein